MEWGFEMPHLRPLQPSLMDELIRFCLTGQGRLFLPGTLIHAHRTATIRQTHPGSHPVPGEVVIDFPNHKHDQP
jgi:hypothetical protein